MAIGGAGGGSGQDVICSGPAIKFADWASIGGRVGASADTGAVGGGGALWR